jgi:multiple sugar transport system ATP-binding protein
LVKVLLQNLTKRFGKVIAVNDLTLKIEDKEFVVLLGPSGCGKTTALRCIAGLELVDSGKIYIGERLVNDLSPKQRDVAMVFQTYALYPHMTVYQNLAFPLENMKWPRQKVEKTVIDIAELLRIEKLLQRRPRQLSGGQRQRVALGRAMVRQPKVFLMDEPLSNLDAKLRVYMRTELKRLQKTVGITTIYVTHDQVEAMTMGDKVAIMNEGVLQQVGDPFEIYFHPANVFVAGFIGSPPTNFFDCTLNEEAPYTLETSEFKYALPEQFSDKAKEWLQRPLVLGVRPQDIMANQKPVGKRGIKAQLDVIEPLGDRQIFNAKIGKYDVKILVGPEQQAKEGQEIWIEFPPERIYIFDKRTGKSLT